MAGIQEFHHGLGEWDGRIGDEHRRCTTHIGRHHEHHEQTVHDSERFSQARVWQELLSAGEQPTKDIKTVAECFQKVRLAVEGHAPKCY